MRFCDKCLRYKKSRSGNVDYDGHWLIGGGVRADVLVVCREPRGSSLQAWSHSALRSMFERHGLGVYNVYVDYSVRCIFSKRFDDLTTQAQNSIISNCREYIMRTIDRLKPKVILCADGESLSSLLGVKSRFPFWQGRKAWWREYSCWVMAFTGTEEEVEQVKELLCDHYIPKQWSWEVVKSYDVFFDKLLESNAVVSLDIETTGLDEEEDELLGIGMVFGQDDNCDELSTAFYFPYVGNVFVDDDCDAFVRRVLKDDRIIKIFHNAGFDVRFLLANGCDVVWPILDSAIGVSIVDWGFEKGLKALAWVYTDFGGYDKQIERSSLFDYDIDRVAEYCCKDAIAAALVVRGLRAKILSNWKFGKLMLDRWVKASRLRLILTYCELLGVRVDLVLLAKIREELEYRIEQLERQIGNSLGDVNLNSPPQLLKALRSYAPLRKLNIRSTDRNSLEAIVDRCNDRGRHLVEALIEYRKTNSLLNTFVKNIEDKNVAGRMRPHFNFIAVRTGRLSCSNPNLQNVPRGEYVRRLFLPEEGDLIVEMDFSQLELRVAAALAGDEEMIGLLNDRSVDIHSEIGHIAIRDSRGNQIPKEVFKQDKNLRVKAKGVSFGVIYGKTPETLAQSLGVSVEEGKRIYGYFFDKFKKLAEWKNNQRRLVMRGEKIITPMGRWFLLENNAAGYRRALNYPVQSTAADIVAEAIIDLYDIIDRYSMPVRILLTVHDSVIFSVRHDELFDEYIYELKSVMEARRQVFDVPVKFYVDVEVGERWGVWSKNLIG